jgi:hypothetical protein
MLLTELPRRLVMLMLPCHITSSRPMQLSQEGLLFPEMLLPGIILLDILLLDILLPGLLLPGILLLDILLPGILLKGLLDPELLLPGILLPIIVLPAILLKVIILPAILLPAILLPGILPVTVLDPVTVPVTYPFTIADKVLVTLPFTTSLLTTQPTAPIQMAMIMATPLLSEATTPCTAQDHTPMANTPAVSIMTAASAMSLVRALRTLAMTLEASTFIPGTLSTHPWMTLNKTLTTP